MYRNFVFFLFQAFSIDEYPTLRSKFNLPEVDVQMGQRNKGFSYYDELIVNEAYGCLGRSFTKQAVKIYAYCFVRIRTLRYLSLALKMGDTCHSTGA